MLSLAFAVVTDAADLPEPTESTIKSVTVYRNQARVVREFKVPANAAIQRFHIAGLPKQFIQGSAFTESDEDTRVRSLQVCLLYTSPSPRDRQKSRMPSSA